MPVSGGTRSSLATRSGYSLAAAAGAIWERVASSIQAIQFAVGVFVLDQLAAFGLGDILLLRWPELLERAWPLAVAGELVQESCLILVIGMCVAAMPALLDTRALRLAAREPRAWTAIVKAALQAEAGVLAFVVVAWLILQILQVDVGQIGNAVFPRTGDWHPGVLEALLLSAVLPGIVEELVFRGIILRTMLGPVPVPLAVLVSSALFGLGHLGSDMTAENAWFVFLYTFVGGSMYALAYIRTGSLYAAILAHIIANTAASLSPAVSDEAMSWVDLVLVELCCLGCLPLLFAASRRIRLALIARSTP